jgi:hypothetical protein
MILFAPVKLPSETVVCSVAPTFAQNQLEMLTVCLNAKQEFDQQLFADNLQRLELRVSALAPPTATSAISMSHVRNLLLGRAYITRCKCCNQRKVKRARSPCRLVGEFEALCDELAKAHGKRSMEKICDPGESALAFGCIRIDGGGMMATVHWHAACGECPSLAQRLAMLAAEMRESTCDRCLQVLSFKAILLLAALEKCSEAPKPQPRRSLECVAFTPNVIDFVLKQMPWQQLLNRLKVFTKH